VWKHFEDCGTIDGVRLIRDKKTCLGKGFGYVTFQVGLLRCPVQTFVCLLKMLGLYLLGQNCLHLTF